MMFRALILLFFLLFAKPGFGQSTFTSPFKFIENQGQWNEAIRYQVAVPSGSIYMLQDKIVYDLIDRDAIHDLKTGGHQHEPSSNLLVASVAKNAILNEMIDAHMFSASFLNANPEARIYPSFKTPEYYSYFLGTDTERWASKIHGHYILNYEDLYENINVSYYATSMGLKYDFLVKPGGCVEDIQIDYTGVEVELDSLGNLWMKTSLGDIIEQKPVAYQVVDGEKVDIEVHFSLEDFTLSFDVDDSYNGAYPLVIDPLLIFSTYSGSPADNWGNTATFDDAGNLYSGGITNHVRGGVTLGEFPATEGAYQMEWGGIWDVAILKYDSAGGELLYATYLGGSGSETPHSTIVNENGELVIFGTTESSNFPTTAGAYQKDFAGGFAVPTTIPYSFGTDLFIAKLSEDGGSLLSSTYFGGSGNDGVNRIDDPLTRNYGDELRGDVNVDASGNIYVTTSTASPDLFAGIDTTKVIREFGGGVTDGMIAKFTPDLRFLQWGSFLGGSGVDGSYTVKLDQINNVYVAGGTTSDDFPIEGGFDTTFGGDVDGWIAVIQTDGSRIVRSTYLGTPAYDQVYFLDLDSEENVFVFGQTRGTGFPITPNTYSNPNSGQFLQKYSKGLDQRLMSTTFGDGTPMPDISPTAFLVNECNNIYIAGWGSTQGTFQRGTFYNFLDTRNLPITVSEAEQTETNGSDFYLAVFSDDAERFLHGTYFGGGDAIVHVDGGTSRFDKAGIVYHAVCADCGIGSSPPSLFTTTENAYSRENLAVSVTNGVIGCNNASFKFDLASLRAGIQTNTVELDMPGISEGCYPYEVVFENKSVGGEIYDWDFGDGTTLTVSSRDTIRHTYEEPGVYTIRLRAFDQNTCVEEAFASTRFTVFDYDFDVSTGGAICEGSEFQLSASGGVSYEWSPPAGLNDASTSTPVATPPDSITYTVRIVDANSCEYIDSIKVDVVPFVSADFTLEKIYECNSIPKVEMTFVGSGDRINWTLGDGSTSQDSTFIFSYSEPGQYRIEVVAEREFCIDTKVENLVLEELFVPTVFTPNDDGLNDFFEIQSSEPIKLSVVDRWGKLQFEMENYDNTWDGGGLASGVYYYELVLPDLTSCQGWVQIIN